MAQVPTYDAFQNSPAPMPDARVDDFHPGNPALELGQDEEQLGADAARAAWHLQHQQNADRVFQAEATVKQNYLDFENQIKQRTGQNAWGVSQDAAKWWNDNLKQASDGLENDEQRAIFNRTMTDMKLQSLGAVSSYEAGQRRISLQQSADASIQSSINIAAANPTRPDIVNSAKQDIAKRVQVLSNLNGWTPEIRDATVSQYTTNLHKQVIESLVDTSPDQARAYFDANKDEIDGADRDGLDKQIKEGTIRQVGQQDSEKIMGMGLSEQDALAYARKNYTGDEQDEVVRRVQERYAETDQLRERSQADAADQAWQIWAKSKNLSDVPTSVLNAMDGRQRDALEREDAAHASGVDIKTDWSTFDDLRTMASKDPKTFSQTDLREYFPKLAAGQREQLIDLQNQVKGNSANDVQTLNEQLNRAHELLGWGNNDGQNKGQFDSAVLTAISAEQQANGGKKLAYADRQKVIDRMMITGSYPGGHWFGSNRFYQIAGTGKESQFTPNVPDTERQKIVEALTRAKLPVTDQAVERLYKLKTGLP